MVGKTQIRKLKPLSAETLRRVMEEFPVHGWSDEEIGELVSPRHGVISGFSQILDDIRAMSEKDLGDIAPAEKLEKETGEK